jgi:hypothetical protein
VANPSAPHHVRRQFCVSLLACLCAGQGAAWAQDGGAVVAQVQSLDREQAERERMRRAAAAAPQGYVDRVMDESPLPSTDTADEDTGNLRSFYVETRVTTARQSDALQLRSSTELGQRIGWRQQTVNHGEFVLEADLRQAQGGNGTGLGPFGAAASPRGERLTLRNIAFPLVPGLYATTAAGDITSQLTDALSRTYRVSLGNSSVRGVSTQVYGDAVDLRAGFGSRGFQVGGPFPGFQRTQGQLAWLGGSVRLRPDLSVGVQAAQGTDLPSLFSATAAPGTGVSVTSLAAGVTTTWTLGDEARMRGRVLAAHSTTDDPLLGRAATGVFTEFTYAKPRERHEFGAFTAQPGLRFGDTYLTFANRGAYWRYDNYGNRMNWGAGLDAERQDAGSLLSGARRVSGSANANWRLNRNTSIGANVAIGHNTLFAGTALPFTTGITSGGSRNETLGAFWQTRLSPGWGRTSLRWLSRRNVQLVGNAPAATGDELLWEQDWLGSDSGESRQNLFATVLGVARDRSLGNDTRSPTAGLQFRLYPGAAWSLGGSLRYTARDSNLSTSRGVSGTLDAERLLEDGWRIGAALSLNQVAVAVPANGLLPPLVARSDTRFASVYLRWDGSRGSRIEGLGAQEPGAGAGALEGVVFFDANRDGERQVTESGVPDVEVVLDGRYTVRTDANGRFNFPLVAIGRRRLALTADTVPLPWGASAEDPLSVQVPLRGIATATLPVVRVGD